MKALTVMQPYAELICRGEKTIENRTWPTHYRGPLLIHAGMSKDWMDDDDWARYPRCLFGYAVATARLVACLRVEDLREELQENHHANGPWCWILEDVQRLSEPVRLSGKQGLWEAEFVMEGQ